MPRGFKEVLLQSVGERSLEAMSDRISTDLMMKGRQRASAIVFDVDGVLTTFKSSWSEVHKSFGSKDSIEDFISYFKGEIDYEEWCKRDISRWREALKRDVTVKDLIDVFSDIENKISEGASEAVSLSKRRGLTVGLLSAGLDISTRLVAKLLNVNLWLANILIFDKRGVLVGSKKVVEPRDKVPALKSMLNKLGISLKDTIYVGDSVVDLTAMRSVGCSIAVKDRSLAKYADFYIDSLKHFPETLILCLHKFNHKGLDGVLWKG